MEIETEQGLLDDHQSTVTHKQYSASSPTHAHTRAVAHDHLTSSRTHTARLVISPHTRRSQFAHKDSLRRVQGKDPTSEGKRQVLAGRALTVHQRGCSLHTCGIQEWCHSVATRHPSFGAGHLHCTMLPWPLRSAECPQAILFRRHMDTQRQPPVHTRRALPHTVAAACLSFEQVTNYVAVITAAATAAMTWAQYRSHNQKVISFTSAVHDLQSRIISWQSLRPAEQTPAKFMQLVKSSEQIIQEARPLGKLSLYELDDKNDVASGTASGKPASPAGKAADPAGKAANSAEKAATDKVATTSEVGSRSAAAS